MSPYTGTFIYTLDVSAISPTPTPSDVLTTYYPIVNTGGSFTPLTPTVDPVTTSTFYTVTVVFTYTDSSDPNDGLSFANIIDTTAKTAVYDITNFSGIPLSRAGSQFQNIPNLIFSYADASVPTILSSTSMLFCFNGCTYFDSSLNTWTDTSNVSSLQATFAGASTFNQALDLWNTSNVTSLNATFASASAFNQPLNNWNTSNVFDMTYTFTGASAFNQPLNNWNTGNLIYMYSTFETASAFNQSLNTWNTSNVIAMNSTFANATAFDGLLNSWNTSKVTDMFRMFNGASAFNRQITYDPANHYWDTTNVTSMDSMFQLATLFNNGFGPGDTTHPMNWIVTNVSVGVDGMPTDFLTGSSLTYLETPHNSPFPANGPSPAPSVICFLEGTKLLCFIDEKEVYVPIQHISRGTLVKTLSQGYKPVELIGFSKLYNPGDILHSKNRLYKCSPEQYPELTEDLIITGCHSILVDEITDIERERTIANLGRIFITENKYRLMACLDKKAEPYTEEGIHTIWHLALENDDYYMNYGIFANGLSVETTSLRMMKELSGMKLLV